MIPLTKKQKESYEKAKTCYIWKKSSKINTPMIKMIVKWKSIIIILLNIEVIDIAYVV